MEDTMDKRCRGGRQGGHGFPEWGRGTRTGRWELDRKPAGALSAADDIVVWGLTVWCVAES